MFQLGADDTQFRLRMQDNIIAHIRRLWIEHLELLKLSFVVGLIDRGNLQRSRLLRRTVFDSN